MNGHSWDEYVIAERLVVDQSFTDRVYQSRFTNHEWGLIMTATEFEIEHAEDPDRARMVANTDQIGSILPELRKIRQNVDPLTGSSTDRSDEGFMGKIKRLLGFDGRQAEQSEDREAAEELTQAYARALQEELEDRGRWNEVCQLAAGDSDESTSMA